MPVSIITRDTVVRVWKNKQKNLQLQLPILTITVSQNHIVHQRIRNHAQVRNLKVQNIKEKEITAPDQRKHNLPTIRNHQGQSLTEIIHNLQIQTEAIARLPIIKTGIIHLLQTTKTGTIHLLQTVKTGIILNLQITITAIVLRLPADQHTQRLPIQEAVTPDQGEIAQVLKIKKEDSFYKH